MRHSSIGLGTILVCAFGGAALGAIAGSLEEDNSCMAGLAVVAGAVVCGGAGLLAGCIAAPIAMVIAESEVYAGASQTESGDTQRGVLLRAAESTPQALLQMAETSRPESGDLLRIPDPHNRIQTGSRGNPSR